MEWAWLGEEEQGEETACGAGGVGRFTEDKAGVRMKMRRPRQRRKRRDGRRRRRVM